MGTKTRQETSPQVPSAGTAAPVTLDGLSERQLRDVIDRATFLLPSRSTSSLPSSSSSEEETAGEVYGAIERAVASAVGRAPPLVVGRAQPWWGKFRRDAADVRAFLERFAPGVCRRRVVRQHIYSRLVGMVVLWLREVRVPVSARAVATNLGRVPGLVDRSFPGYAESGVLGWAFRVRD